ncbi:MAG: DUF4870 domain-containing protein [Bacteroidales bacterium]|nr:DUF4870 domain-containing protein [Bacteroidales bacterium]
MEIISDFHKKPGMDSGQEKTWAMLCHIASFAHFIPLGHIFCPLIIWLLKKDESELVDDQGKESLNFQLSMTIYFLLAIPFVFLVIGIPLLIILGVIDLILVILAAVSAAQGQAYRYPLSIKFIK